MPVKGGLTSSREGRSSSCSSHLGEEEGAAPTGRGGEMRLNRVITHHYGQQVKGCKCRPSLLPWVTLEGLPRAGFAWQSFLPGMGLWEL